MDEMKNSNFQAPNRFFESSYFWEFPPHKTILNIINRVDGPVIQSRTCHSGITPLFLSHIYCTYTKKREHAVRTCFIIIFLFFGCSGGLHDLWAIMTQREQGDLFYDMISFIFTEPCIFILPRLFFKWSAVESCHWCFFGWCSLSVPRYWRLDEG